MKTNLRSRSRTAFISNILAVTILTLAISSFAPRASAATQDNWRYCDKCHAKFFDGYADKGRCPSGGGHHAQGYNFVLRYHGNLEGNVELHPVDG